MADLPITEATALASLAATDVMPVARPADATAYKATMAAIKAYVNTSPIVTPSSVVTANWNQVVGQVEFNGHPDQVMFIGFNANSVGGLKDDAAQPDIHIGFESDYWHAVDAHISEWYVTWVAPATAFTRRTIHLTWDFDTGYTDIDLNADRVSFRTADALTTIATCEPTKWTLYQDMLFAANKGVILNDRSDGHTYRLKVTNGTLGTEQVT